MATQKPVNVCPSCGAEIVGDLLFSARQLECAEFEVFWDAYPRNPRMKTRGSKVMAQKAWAKLKPSAEVRSIILASVAQFAHTQQWRDGYIPHAATFLNQRRWEDVEAAPLFGSAATNTPLSDLLDRAGIKLHDQSQWFACVALRGHVLVASGPTQADWIRRHYLDALAIAHGAPMTVVVE